jgi:RNA polymerase sigma-70 factor (ECF subfamily)
MSYCDYLILLAHGGLDPQPQARPGSPDDARQAPGRSRGALDRLHGPAEQHLAEWLQALAAGVAAGGAPGYRSGAAGAPPGRAVEESVVWLEADLSAGRLSPEEIAARNERLLRLAAALDRLPDDQRAALELMHLHGLSVAEIGARTGRSRLAVAESLCRGMAALRALLEGPGPGAEREGR